MRTALPRLAPKILLLVAALALAGCPKKIPQPEIDAAERAMADLDKLKDCAPELVAAARAAMEQAEGLMKAEKYDEAKAAYLAARSLADKARKECDEKKKAAEEAEKKRLAELAAQEAARAMNNTPAEAPSGPAALVTVLFDFNAAELTDKARADLEQNAEYLRARPALRVQVEGHCDSRGSTEYNLALGERRAMATRQFLVKLGVDPERLEIISFGEERPADPDSTEEAFGKNRRAEFRELQ
ncbi:MAG TPA: OmpA family protein [Myxococcota bacterium]|nr:OmpA family protein [Myxococcota bacterium]HRY93184.1 OmpA family protein [Myxococcota bacterium]